MSDNSLAWDDGDFNGDGFVDGQDFVLWNSSKFTSSDVKQVPETGGVNLLPWGLSAGMFHKVGRQQGCCLARLFAVDRAQPFDRQKYAGQGTPEWAAAAGCQRY